MEAPSRKIPSLPTNRAFVVQFRAEADVQQGRFEGRIEHVVSGQAAHFHSPEELLAFLTHVLDAYGVRHSRIDSAK